MEKAVWIVITVAVALIIGVIIVASTSTTMKQLTSGTSHKIKNIVGQLGEGAGINGGGDDREGVSEWGNRLNIFGKKNENKIDRRIYEELLAKWEKENN